MIDTDCAEPIYLQIDAIMRRRIESGAWPVHSRIKDENTLATEFGVSRGTLRKALKNLIGAGLLTQVKGKGTFVIADVIQQPLASRLISFSEAMDESGVAYTTVLRGIEVIEPDPQAAAFLELENLENLVRIRRVRLVHQRPVIYLENYVPSALCPDLEKQDFTQRTLFSILEDQYGHRIRWARRYFRAVPAAGENAFNLSLPAGTPVIFLEQIMYASMTKPLEYSKVWINSDRYDIVSVLNR